MSASLFAGIIACGCFGAGLAGAGNQWALYTLIFSFFAVFGGETELEG